MPSTLTATATDFPVRSGTSPSTPASAALYLDWAAQGQCRTTYEFPFPQAIPHRTQL